MDTNSPEVQAAAGWWAKIIGDAPQDNGEAFQSALMTAFRGKSEIADEQREQFKALLAEKIASRRPWCLGVDYDPCPILRDAATEAGIAVRFCCTFPVKTCMWIKEGEVSVSCGYGAKVEVIYPAAQAA